MQTSGPHCYSLPPRRSPSPWWLLLLIPIVSPILCCVWPLLLKGSSSPEVSQPANVSTPLNQTTGSVSSSSSNNTPQNDPAIRIVYLTAKGAEEGMPEGKYRYFFEVYNDRYSWGQRWSGLIEIDAITYGLPDQELPLYTGRLEMGEAYTLYVDSAIGPPEEIARFNYRARRS